MIVWIPLLRILPQISNWPADRRLSRLYASLRRQEQAIAAARTPQDIEHHLRALTTLAESCEMLARKTPASRHGDLYHFRLHVAMVRDETAARLASMGAPPGGSRVRTRTRGQPGGRWLTCVRRSVAWSGGVVG